RRRVREAKDTMNRLYVVENRFTLTGSMADHRMEVPASQIPAITYLLAKKVADVTNDATLGSVLGKLAAPSGTEVFDDQWLTEAVNDLVGKSGASLVVAGPDQSAGVHAIVYAVNLALKNLGRTIVAHAFPRNQKRKSLAELVEAIQSDRIKQLF